MTLAQDLQAVRETLEEAHTLHESDKNGEVRAALARIEAEVARLVEELREAEVNLDIARQNVLNFDEKLARLERIEEAAHQLLYGLDEFGVSEFVAESADLLNNALAVEEGGDREAR